MSKKEVKTVMEREHNIEREKKNRKRYNGRRESADRNKLCMRWTEGTSA